MSLPLAARELRAKFISGSGLWGGQLCGQVFSLPFVLFPPYPSFPLVNYLFIFLAALYIFRGKFMPFVVWALLGIQGQKQAESQPSFIALVIVCSQGGVPVSGLPVSTWV